MTCPLRLNAQDEERALIEEGNYAGSRVWKVIGEQAIEMCLAGEPIVNESKKYGFFGKVTVTSECATKAFRGIRPKFYISKVNK